jgi:hypothetical protein
MDTSSLGMLRRFVRKFGPYLALAIIVPGGTVLALLLFLGDGGVRSRPTD